MDHDLKLWHEIKRLIVIMVADDRNEEVLLLRAAQKRFVELSTYFTTHPDDKVLSFARMNQMEYTVYRDATRWEAFKAVVFGVISRHSYHGGGVYLTQREESDPSIIRGLNALHFELVGEDRPLEAEDVRNLVSRLIAMTAVIKSTDSGPRLQWIDGYSRVLSFRELVMWKLFKAYPSELYR